MIIEIEIRRELEYKYGWSFYFFGIYWAVKTVIIL